MRRIDVVDGHPKWIQMKGGRGITAHGHTPEPCVQGVSSTKKVRSQPDMASQTFDGICPWVSTSGTQSDAGEAWPSLGVHHFTNLLSIVYGRLTCLYMCLRHRQGAYGFRGGMGVFTRAGLGRPGRDGFDRARAQTCAYGKREGSVLPVQRGTVRHWSSG